MFCSRIQGRSIIRNKNLLYASMDRTLYVGMKEIMQMMGGQPASMHGQFYLTQNGWNGQSIEGGLFEGLEIVLYPGIQEVSFVISYYNEVWMIYFKYDIYWPTPSQSGLQFSKRSFFLSFFLYSLWANFLFFIQYSTGEYSTVQVFIWCLVLQRSLMYCKVLYCTIVY